MDSLKDFNLSIKIEGTEMINDYNESDIMPRFDGSDDLEIIRNSDIFETPSFFTDDNDSESDDEIISLHMDIQAPIKTLKTLLGKKLGINMNRYEFWLQDAQILEPHKNLVDQCVKGEGLVQINVQVRTSVNRINIVDVLKPTEEALAEIEVAEKRSLSDRAIESDTEDVTVLPTINDGDIDTSDKEETVKWVIDHHFKRDLARLKIPDDPKEWTTAQVKHWLQWAVRQFNLSQIKLQDWSMPGKDLVTFTIDEFRRKVPFDPGDVFWTHFELLRKCKFLATIQRSDAVFCSLKGAADPAGVSFDNDFAESPPRLDRTNSKNLPKYDLSLEQIQQLDPSSHASSNRSGNNGQIQLWQFLLEILTDKQHRDIIQWLNGKGEFKLSDPEKVAQLWGERKNKPTMNYEKLSRALRYYYDGDMICKVHGKRFVYQFVCDLQQLIGYSAQELLDLVNEYDSRELFKGLLE